MIGRIKKKIFLIFIFILVIFPSSVFGAGTPYDTVIYSDGNVKNVNKVVYSVERFNISNDGKMTFNGYAFIEHMHNYGIIPGKSNGKGNLKTYLIAYTGEWQDEYKTCSSDDANCMKFSAEQRQRDMYMLRCEDGDYCKGSLQRDLRNGKKENALNNEKQCNYPGKDKSYCLYYNVGFNVSVSLTKLETKFSDEDINFRIVVELKSNLEGKSRLLSSDFGVYQGICQYNGRACDLGNNGSLNVGDYELNLTGMSNKATIAEGSWARTCEEGGHTTDCYVPDLEFSDEEFIIVGITNPRNLSDANPCFHSYNVSSEGLTWCDRVYEVASYRSESDNRVHASTDKKTTGNFYAYGGWMTITGKMTISGLKPSIIKETCKTLFSNTSSKVNDVDCGNTGKYNQCISKPVEGMIYYPISNMCDAYGEKFPDGKYYKRIMVSTDVLLNQNAVFSFGKIPVSVVSAGKGFEIGDVSYHNTITWVNANRTKNNNIPYYSYGSSIHYTGNSCVESSISLNSDANTLVYYIDGNGNKVKTKLSDASFEVINIAVQKLIKDKEENLNEKIKFKSCDSNDSSECNISNPNLEVNGNWENIESGVSDYEFKGKIFGKTITNKFEYTLGTSYVMVKGDTPAKVKYTELVSDEIEKYIDAGEKFYVDFKWTSKRDWPFNLEKDLNPSLIDDMIWKLNGTCGIKVKDGYYTSASGPGDPEPDDDDEVQFLLKYRSISLDEPFPKNVASNWQNWWNNSANKVRISNTFQYSPIYNVVLTKFDKIDAVKLSDINSINRHYIDISNMNLNGTSTFVQNYFKTDAAVVSDKSFCELGKFSTDCDLWGDS